MLHRDLGAHLQLTLRTREDIKDTKNHQRKGIFSFLPNFTWMVFFTWLSNFNQIQLHDDVKSTAVALCHTGRVKFKVGK